MPYTALRCDVGVVCACLLVLLLPHVVRGAASNSSKVTGIPALNTTTIPYAPSGGSDTFFKIAFGHHEGSYLETQMRMREAAELTPADPDRDWIDIPTLPVPPERCVFQRADQTTIDAGVFYEPSLGELRAEVKALLRRPEVEAALASVTAELELERGPRWSHEAGDAMTSHQMSAASGAVFQAASQFNYLEFAQPDAKPEDGISCYAYDHTQGPACATACPAGTAYRNYLVQPSPEWGLPHGQRGQRANLQRNSLHDLEQDLLKLRPELSKAPWDVVNGYTQLPEPEQLTAIQDTLLDAATRDRLMSKLRVGVQQDTEVMQCDHKTSQVYCSAMSVAYSGVPAAVWEPLATLVLDAAYEATLLVGVKNTLRWMATKPAGPAALPPVFLTLVGAGVFGNRLSWVSDAMGRAHDQVATLGVPLNVVVLHYRAVNHVLVRQTDTFTKVDPRLTRR